MQLTVCCISILAQIAHHEVTENVFSEEPPENDPAIAAQQGVTSHKEDARLYLKIMSGRNLKAKDFGGTSDPYCVITCNKEVCITGPLVRKVT